MNKKTLILLSLLASVSICNVSTRVDLMYDYLNFGMNARVQALGNTGMISAEGAEAVYYNPALLYANKNASPILISYNPMYFDRNYFYGFYQFDIKNRNTKIGLGYIGDMISDIEYRSTRTDTPTNTSISHSGIILSLARIINSKTFFGFSMNLLSDNYSTLTNGLGNYQTAYSFGYYLQATSKIGLAATYKYFADYGHIIALGAKIPLSTDIVFYPVGSYCLNYGDGILSFKFGVEYLYSNMISLQCGLDGENISSGITIYQKNMNFGYALIINPVGIRHNFSIEF